jgi:hypothetical protein
MNYTTIFYNDFLFHKFWSSSKNVLSQHEWIQLKLYILMHHAGMVWAKIR